MTDAEKIALKAEITAELGRHLDEHYVRKSTLDAAAQKLTAIVTELRQELAQLIAEGRHLLTDHEERLLDIEMSLVFEDAIKRIPLDPGPKQDLWGLAHDLRSKFRKSIQTRVMKLFDESSERTLPPELGAKVKAVLEMMLS